MRQVVLDTETTGLEPERGHRIIEIGCVEIVNRRTTGRTFHQYLNPERDIDYGAETVHGLTLAKLADKPRFAQVADELLQFIGGAELLIHNAAFDVAFIEHELRMLAEALGRAPQLIAQLCRVSCTLTLAREMHPGQRNSLDALCKRYEIENAHRTLHGALLDARLLADVYLAMTGGQSAFLLEDLGHGHLGESLEQGVRMRPAVSLRVIEASDDELAEHAAMLAIIDKASKGRTLWAQA